MNTTSNSNSAVDVMEKPNKEEALMEADTSVVGDTTEAMEATGAMMADAGEYLDYSDAAFAAAADKKRVLFFHATWCPDCKAANTEIISMAEKIPADVAIFKADYDTQKELKKKYGIANQHSFVLVNTAGEAITKWNGGTFATLLGKVQ